MKPLQGKIMLDLTHMLSGPYGTMLLTDLGVRTIKVEPPGGEQTRELLDGDPDYSRGGLGVYFLTLNRGKESVCLDLKSDAGREVFYDLVRHADIVFDNFAVGVTRRLGIDHATLAAINPRIVTCSVTGFGETGSDNERPAFDQVVQAMSGGMSITGMRGDTPVRWAVPIGDMGGGAIGALGVLAALIERDSSGVGRHVDISMLDVQVSLLNYMATMYLMSGQLPERIGNEHFVHVPYNVYATQDGHLVIACIGDAFFERLREVIDHPLLQRPEFARQPARLAAKDEIDAAVGAVLATRPTAEWLPILRAARVPCGPVNNFAQALADPQVQARHMVVEVPLDGGGSVRMPGNPVKFSDGVGAGDEGPQSFGPPPALGRDTDSVLSDLLGYPSTRIASLRSEKSVG